MRMKTLTTLAAGLLFVSTGIAAAQSDKEQKPEQLQQNQAGTSGTEAGSSRPQPGAASGQSSTPSQSGMSTTGRSSGAPANSPNGDAEKKPTDKK